MRRRSLFLLAAAQRGFARHPDEDLQAFPQYEVVFADSYISEHEAESLVDKSQAYASYDAGFATYSDLSQQIREAGPQDGPAAKDDEAPLYEYEIMNMPPSKYLCSIPILDEYTRENRTATELAKAEEQKELARATERGWQLLNDMNGDCLHFMSGWWSYRFCYGKEIIQYHALPSVPNGQPPAMDPQTAHYVLGRATGPVSDSDLAVNQRQRPPNTDLQSKGDERFLVQKLGRGTVCDLTERERTIEVQYHCVPTMVNDRIAYIKEVTTCAYLMVVHTPRLCADVAFLPPQPVSANPILCRPIAPSEKLGGGGGAADDDEEHSNHDPSASAETTAEVKDREGHALRHLGDPRHPPVIGGIVVGGHNILAADGEGATAVTLEAPHRYMPGSRQTAPTVVVVASRSGRAEGGQTERMDRDALKRLGVDAALIDETVRKLEAMAGDAGWKIEVVDEPGRPRELRAFVDVEDESELDDAAAAAAAAAAVAAEQQQEQQGGGQDYDGSQEHFFHEEL